MLPKTPPKKTIKIILLRHGQTHSNLDLSSLEQKHKTDPTLTTPSYLLQKHHLSTSQTPLHLNTPLNPTGLSQCLLTSSILTQKYPNIKKIFLSPLRRTIQTFENTTENHPNFPKFNIQFCEHLRETLWANCDLPIWLSEYNNSIKYGNRYNWDFINKYSDKKFWWLENCTIDKYNEAIEVLKDCENDEEKVIKFLEFLWEFNPGPWETHRSCFLRTDRGKDEIREVVEREGWGDGEVLVVSHGGTIRQFTATKLDGGWREVEGGVRAENCEIVEYELDMEKDESIFPEKLVGPVFLETKKVPNFS